MNNKQCVIGAILGDIIGSIYEDSDINSYDFSLFTNKSDFTDDSVLTIATMDCLLKSEDYATMYKIYARKFPDRGYGMGFTNWLLKSKPFPYNSCGNGSAMRVSPMAWYYESLDDVLAESKRAQNVLIIIPKALRVLKQLQLVFFLRDTVMKKNN